MTGEIFLIDNDGNLVSMQETAFVSEDRFQELLADYPNLLAGDQIDSANPRKWLLIDREVGIPDEEAGADRWSVDHLFLDQDGIPTLVEVKRSSDTRLRREVVGQLLEYAANAILYWPVEKIQSYFELRCEKAGMTPDEVLANFLDEDKDIAEFWRDVKTNFTAGKIRLIFVADKIPLELQSIIEFLDGQMDPAQVLGIEIRQFRGKNRKTLVPRVVGKTATSTQKKSSGARSKWNSERFFKILAEENSSEIVKLSKTLLNFGEELTGRKVEWGSGISRGSFTARLVTESGRYSLFSVYTSGEFSFNLGWNYSRSPGIDFSEKYRALINKKFDLAIERRSWENGWPIESQSILQAAGRLQVFKDLMREYVDAINKAEH